jgi:hypothetical protein
MIRRLAILLAIVAFLGFGAATVYALRRAHSWDEIAATASQNARNYGAECTPSSGSFACDVAEYSTGEVTRALGQRYTWNRRVDRFTLAAFLAPLLVFVTFAAGRWVFKGNTRDQSLPAK